MSDTLTDLFDQIIHSEQRAQKRNSYLQELKTKICTCEKTIEETKDERETLRGQLVLKVQHLNDEELQYKWLQSQRRILSENEGKLQNEKAELKKELEDIKDTFMNKMSQFCSSVQQFSQQYDLLSMGKLTREKDILDKIVQCEEKEQQLAKDLACYEESRLCINKMEMEKDQLEQQLATQKDQLHEMNETLLSEQNLLQKLEEQREETLQLPQKGAEFQRLQKELDELQSSHLDSQCQKLQQDIRSLQHQIRQQQIQQQQQQREQQQQEVQKQHVFHQKQSQQQFGEQQRPSLNAVEIQPSHTHEQFPVSTANRHCVSNFPKRNAPTIHNIQKESTEFSSPDILSHVFDDDMSLPDLNDSNVSDDSSTNPSTPDVSSNTLEPTYHSSNNRKPIFKYKKY